MKRDLELCREILLQVEKADEPVALPYVAKSHDRNVVWYHLGLLKSAGFIDAVLVESDDGECVRGRIDGITWDGQDYLDAIRDDDLWWKVKKAVKDSLGSTTFDVVKQVATSASIAAASAFLRL